MTKQEVNRKRCTYKLPLQLALGGARLPVSAGLRGHAQVVVHRQALPQVGRPRPQLGEGRLGAGAGLRAGSVPTTWPRPLHHGCHLPVVLQPPQLA